MHSTYGWWEQGTFPNLHRLLTRHRCLHSQSRGSHSSDQNSHVSHQHILLPSIRETGSEIIHLNTAWWTWNQIKGRWLLPEDVSPKPTGCPMTWLFIVLGFNVQSPDCTGQMLSAFISLIPHFASMPKSPSLLSYYFYSSVNAVSLVCVWPRSTLTIGLTNGLLPFVLILSIKPSEPWGAPPLPPHGGNPRLKLCGLMRSVASGHWWGLRCRLLSASQNYTV